jgi:hypothetical protein
MFIRTNHWSQSWTRWIQSTLYYLISNPFQYHHIIYVRARQSQKNDSLAGKWFLILVGIQNKIYKCLFIQSRVGVTYKTGFGSDDWIYSHSTRNYRQYSTIAILHTLHSTVTHAPGFLVFTSRILTTDLSHSHCNVKSHVKYSLHGLISLLPFLLNHRLVPSPELHTILSTTVLYSAVLRPVFWLYLRITPRHGPHGKHRVILSRIRVYWSVI